MSRILLGLLIASSAGGCQRFTVRTQNRVAFDGPVETRVSGDLPPVSPFAGRVKPVVVRTGDPAARVAVVDVDGLLLNAPFAGLSSVGENPVALFREKLDAVEADPGIVAVVLRVNSPGGGAAAARTMRRDLDRFKSRSGKPVVACLLDTAAGGAYVLAAGADQIVADPAGVVGGVGVILNLFNLRDLMAQFNVLPQQIKAGANIDAGASTRALTDDDKAILQPIADDLHRQLIDDVVRGRPGVDRANGTTFDGRVFPAAVALARHLVDRIGDLDEAIDLAAGLARPGCPPGGVRGEAVLYRRLNDPAYTAYAVTANVPIQGAGLFPSVPGIDRTKLPTFLSLWQPEPTAEKLGGK